MAIRAVVSFDNVPTEQQIHPAGATNYYPDGTPFNLQFSNATYGRGNFYRDPSDGFFVAYTGGSGAYTVVKNTALHCPLKDLFPGFSNSGAYLGGVRFKATNNSVFTAVQFSGALTTSGLVANANEVVNVFSLTDWAWVANEDVYLEWELNFDTGYIYRRVDSVAISPIPIPAWLVTQAAAGDGIVPKFVLGTVSSRSMLSNVLVDLRVKDLIFMERTPDGVDSTWKGPITISVLSPTVVDVGDWTASAGTVESALKTQITSVASRTKPNVSSGGEMKELKLSYDASSLPKGKIHAVVFQGSGKRQSGTSTQLSLKVVDGSKETPATSISLLASDYRLGVTSQILSKDLDGNQLTAEKVSSLILSIKPTLGD